MKGLSTEETRHSLLHYRTKQGIKEDVKKSIKSIIANNTRRKATGAWKRAEHSG